MNDYFISKKVYFCGNPQNGWPRHPRRAATCVGPVNDWEQCTLFEKKYFPVEPLACLDHGHITCAQVQPLLLPDMWDSYFKFCFVRNPYDRFVSYCYFINRDNRRMSSDPLGRMKTIIQDEKTRRQLLFRPQHEFIFDKQGGPMVDYVGRFEALQDHFNVICGHIGLPPSKLGYLNPVQRPSYQVCYDGKLMEMVRDFYAKDFALFEYPPELERI